MFSGSIDHWVSQSMTNPIVTQILWVGVWTPKRPNLRRCLWVQTPILTRYDGKTRVSITKSKQNRNTVEAKILHQLRLVVYPIIYKVLYIPGGERRISEPSTVSTSPFALLFWVTLLWNVWFPWCPHVRQKPGQIENKDVNFQNKAAFFWGCREAELKEKTTK